MDAYLYARISSDKQRLGGGIQRQIERAVEYADNYNLTLIDPERYVDLGLSGYHGDNSVNGRLGVFLDCLNAGRIKTPCILLSESLDRLSREEVLNAFSQFTQIVQAGVIITTLIGEPTSYSRETISINPGLLFMAIASMQRAYDESATKSDRAQKAHKAIREGKKKHRGIAPKWLDLDEQNNWVFNPERKAVVERMVDLYLNQGKGAVHITNVLNAESVPTFGYGRINRETGERNPTSWSKGAVRKIMLNPSLAGQYIPHRGLEGKELPPIDGFYPAIITMEQHSRIKQISKQNRLNKGRTGNSQDSANVFQRKIYCNECGCPLHYRRVKSGVKWVCYVVCSGRLAKNGCSLPWVPYLRLEMEVVRGMLRSLRNQGTDWTGETADTIESLKFKIEELKQREDKAAEQYFSTSASLSEKAKLVAEDAANQRALLEDELQGLEVESKQLLSFSEARYVYDDLRSDRVRLRQFVLSYLGRLEVHSPDTYVITLKDGHWFFWYAGSVGKDVCEDEGIDSPRYADAASIEADTKDLYEEAKAISLASKDLSVAIKSFTP